MKPKFMTAAFGQMYELTNKSNDLMDKWTDGRWARDTAESNMATAYYLKCHPDRSTIDLIRLHAGLDGWTLAPGGTGYDVAVGRI